MQNFSKNYQISLENYENPRLGKYENLDISLSKTTEILRNSGKNPVKFDEKTAKSAASNENQQKMHEMLQKWCKGPEKSQKSGMVQRKKCRA